VAAHHLVQDGALDLAAMLDWPERPLPLLPENALALPVPRPPAPLPQALFNDPYLFNTTIRALP
jgi:hypothetical protein